MLKTLNKLRGLLDRQAKIQFVTLFILLIFKSILDGFGLGLIAPYIATISNPDSIFKNNFFNKLNTYLNIGSNDELILWMSVFLIVFFIFKNVFSILVLYFQSRLIFTKRSIQGRKLFQLYMDAPFIFHLDHNTAELDRNIRFESTNVFGFFQSFLLFCSNAFLTISIFVVLMIANWQAVLGMSFFIIIFSSLFLFFSGKYSTNYGIEVQESQLHIGQSMKEGLSSIIESKLNQIESFFPNRYFKHMMSNARANWSQATLGTAPIYFFEILAVGALVGVILVLFINETDINSVLPILGLFSFAFIRIIPSVTAMIKNLQQIKFLAPAVDVIYKDFKYLEKISKNSKLISELKIKKIDFKNLIIKNVNFSFSKKNILKNISLDLNKGQAIGITGPSGSGKTTLINLILGLFSPDSGQVNLNGEKLENNLNSWYALIGYVPQSITLIDASIRENIALGVKESEIDDKKIWSVLKDANLITFVKEMSEQLDTLIGENGVRLSGGQRQRLGLARALYRDPKVIIFDEATSSLDVETEKRITKEIMGLTGKRTLIIVAHRLSTIKDCEKIYFIKDGEIMNSGTFSDLQKLNNDFKKLSNQSEVSFG